MKKSILALFTILAFASCKNSSNDSDSRNIQLLTDTTSYHNNSIYTDTVASVKNEVAASQKPVAPIVVTKIIREVRVVSNEGAKAPAVNTSNTGNTAATIPPVAVTPPVITPTNEEPSVNNGTVGIPGKDNNTTTASIPEPAKKKGWNQSTKGAVIGGVAGAIGGAVIGKKKVMGGVIGGIVGAAGGYIIGKDLEKKKANKSDL